jgi:hypothetical protein
MSSQENEFFSYKVDKKPGEVKLTVYLYKDRDIWLPLLKEAVKKEFTKQYWEKIFFDCEKFEEFYYTKTGQDIHITDKDRIKIAQKENPEEVIKHK